MWRLKTPLDRRPNLKCRRMLFYSPSLTKKVKIGLRLKNMSIIFFSPIYRKDKMGNMLSKIGPRFSIDAYIKDQIGSPWF